jgi:hypothetical protein
VVHVSTPGARPAPRIALLPGVGALLAVSRKGAEENSRLHSSETGTQGWKNIWEDWVYSS